MRAHAMRPYRSAGVPTATARLAKRLGPYRTPGRPTRQVVGMLAGACPHPPSSRGARRAPSVPDCVVTAATRVDGDEGVRSRR